MKIKLYPFFNDYPIQGIKSLDFADFKKVAEIIKNKDHLTDKGFNEIKKIVDGMNLDRRDTHNPPPAESPATTILLGGTGECNADGGGSVRYKSRRNKV